MKEHSHIEISMENSMIIISINGENKYGIDSLYEINFKGNEKIEVNVIWYDHLRMKP